MSRSISQKNSLRLFSENREKCKIKHFLKTSELRRNDENLSTMIIWSSNMYNTPILGKNFQNFFFRFLKIFEL